MKNSFEYLHQDYADPATNNAPKRMLANTKYTNYYN